MNSIQFVVPLKKLFSSERTEFLLRFSKRLSRPADRARFPNFGDLIAEVEMLESGIFVVLSGLLLNLQSERTLIGFRNAIVIGVFTLLTAFWIVEILQIEAETT